MATFRRSTTPSKPERRAKSGVMPSKPISRVAVTWTRLVLRHTGRRGVHLQRGQAAAEIARLGDLVVIVKLDESDADRIHEGLAATITGPGFPGLALTGRVASVASQALSADAPPGASPAGAQFPAKIALDHLTADQVRAVRLGMTANVTITVQHNDAAVVVPSQAVQGAGPSATVMVVNPRTGKVTPRSVSLGGVAADGVQVTAGLKPGDEVTWETGQPPPP